MGLFTPAWNSKDPEKRMKKVKDIVKIEKLQKIAEQAKYMDVQQAALTRLALEAKDGQIRKAATEKITDEITLAKVAINDLNSDVRKAAIEKVRHPEILTKVALSEMETLIEAENFYNTMPFHMMNQPAGTRLLSKNEYLSQIRSRCYSDVRIVAIKGISDQNILKTLTLNDSNSSVRMAAIEKINDQNILANIAKNSKDSDVRVKAVKKITGQSILVDIAKNDSNKYVRIAAIENVNDQTTLATIAKNDSDYNVRSEAIKKITDKNILTDVAKSSNHKDARIEAVKKLTDQNVLTNIARNDEDEDVGIAAVKKLTGQEALISIVKNNKNKRLCEVAAERLSNIFRETDSANILPETIEIVIKSMSTNRLEISDKLLKVSKSNPNILKPFFPSIKTELNKWHNDSPHIDTQHEDHRDTAPGHLDGSGGFGAVYSSRDCVHTDGKRHTDRKHADDHKGKACLAKFPPFFND